MLFRTLVSAAALVAQAAAYANPGACSGECWTHDPSVVKRADGTYFRFATGSKIGIWKATSLSGPWSYQGAAIPKGSSINLDEKDDLWAPDVYKVGDQYVMYYSVSTFGSQNSAIGYATSSTLEAGSWTDHGATGIASSSTSSLPYNAIDGNLILASTTSKYLATFGSFWSGIYQVPVTNGVAASGTSYQVQFQPAGAHPSEGPFVFERSGWYYLFWSEGTCCGYDSSRPAKGAEYKIRVCRSQNPAGPYFDRDGTSCTNGGGTTVLESHDNIYGPGGQGVFADSAVGTVLYYHYVDTTVGYADGDKKFGWNVLNWSSGWPSV